MSSPNDPENDATSTVIQNAGASHRVSFHAVRASILAILFAALEFLVHLVVGTILFAALWTVAAVMNLYVHFLVHLKCDKFVTDPIEAFEYGIMVVDYLLVTIFYLKISYNFAKRLWNLEH